MRRIFLLALALLVLAPPPHAHATFFGAPGDIAFSMLVGEPDLEIYNTDLFLVRPDGSRARAITDSGFGENNPHFSPDGRELLFYRDSEGMVIRRRVNGVRERILARQHVTATHFWKPFAVNWSPDGTRLVMQWQSYDRERDVWAESAIVVMRADGSKPRTIVPTSPGVTYWQPKWSPDGQLLVFERWGPEGVTSDIMVVNATGGEPREVSTGTPYDFAPTWTPDGRIMYVTRTCVAHHRCTEVRSIAADGSGMETMFPMSDLGRDGYPDAVFEAATSPDGTALLITLMPTAYTPATYAPWELWKYDLESGHAARLVEDYEGDADWQPRCTLRGTHADDVLRGTSGRDLICGLGGNDTIRGFGGDDVIFGHGGDDVITGGKGRDIVVGNTGSDRCDRDPRDFSRVC